MDAKQWREAAKRYDAQKAQQAQDTAAATNAAYSKALGQRREQQDYQANVAAAISELNDFLAGEDWLAARQLLIASNRHIVIAEENEGGGSGIVYFLDGNGLRQSIEAMGTWMAYAKKDSIPKPRISPAKVAEVVRLAIRQGAHPHQILENIKQGLDSIAQLVIKE